MSCVGLQELSKELRFQPPSIGKDFNKFEVEIKMEVLKRRCRALGVSATGQQLTLQQWLIALRDLGARASTL